MTAQQLELAAALRDEGMAQVTEASDGWARACVDDAIRKHAQTGLRFSANTLRDVLPEVRPALVGARFRAAAMRGLIRRVGYVPSTLPSTRAHPIAEWVGTP